MLPQIETALSSKDEQMPQINASGDAVDSINDSALVSTNLVNKLLINRVLIEIQNTIPVPACQTAINKTIK